MTRLDVPVVDIGPWIRPGEGPDPAEARAKVVTQIDTACREVGFIQITGHQIPDQVWTGLAEAIDAFFGLDLEVKRGWIRPPQENRGYTAPKSETLALSAGVQSQTRMKDFFEAFNVAVPASSYPGHDLMVEHYAENTWPQRPELEAFRSQVEAWMAEAGRVARTLTQIFATALGLGQDWFDAITRHPIEVLRMNNYALPDGTRVEVDEDLIGMGEHTDFGIVTVLWADDVTGLQVLHHGQWYDVSPAPGALLVNLGDLTTRLTNERWLSTLHRVKPPIVDGTIARRRSAAFFFDGDPEAVVGPLPQFVDADHRALYAPVTIDEHISAKLSGSRAGILNERAERESERLTDLGSR